MELDVLVVYAVQQVLDVRQLRYRRLEIVKQEIVEQTLVLWAVAMEYRLHLLKDKSLPGLLHLEEVAEQPAGPQRQELPERVRLVLRVEGQDRVR